MDFYGRLLGPESMNPKGLRDSPIPVCFLAACYSVRWSYIQQWLEQQQNASHAQVSLERRVQPALALLAWALPVGCGGTRFVLCFCINARPE